MKLISYNLEKHRAVEELSGLIRKHHPSAVCVQEARVPELPSEIEGLSLVASTPRNRLGLAIYADKERYEPGDSFMRSFDKTLHDIIAAPAEHRLLGSVLRDRATGEYSVLASFHASPLTASNRHRRMQIVQSLASIESMAPSVPFIMAGDYNYPLFRQDLHRSLAAAGYDLSFSDLGTYRKSIFGGHFDFVTSRGYTVDSVQTLKQKASDHKPILVSAERRNELPSNSLETVEIAAP